MTPPDARLAVGTDLGARPWTDQATEPLPVLRKTDIDPHCPAATGYAWEGALDCRANPDGVHRCHRAPVHGRSDRVPTGMAAVAGRDPSDHVCDCGFVWTDTHGGAAALLQARTRAETQGAAVALTRVLGEVRGSGLPWLPVLESLVHDVARDLKIELTP